VSILQSYPKRAVKDFYGVNSRAEASNVGPPFGLVARNIEYLPQSAKTRKGIYQEGTALTLTGIGQLHAWFRADAGKTQLAWMGSNGGGNGEIRTMQYDAGSSALVQTSGFPMGYATMRDYGNLLFFSFLDNSFTAATGFWYYDYAAATSYIGAREPLTTAEFTMGFANAAVTSGMSAGTRLYATVFQTRSGYLTRPSPVATSGTPKLGVPQSHTNAANDGVTVTLTPTGTWPNDIVGAYLLVTTVSNQARIMWAPVASITITPGGAGAVSFPQLKASDGIISQQRDALDQDGLLTSQGANSPFHPRFIFSMGARMAYCLGSTNNSAVGGPGVMFSDTAKPESFAIDRNYRFLLGKQEPVCGFYHQGVAYILGHNFTQAFNDTGGYPATWPNPRQISGKIGTSHINGVYVDPSGIGLVAHQSGLYVFSNGAYSELPISYYQKAEWARILWPQPGGSVVPFQIGEDRANQMIFVLCTTAAGPRVFMWDYSAGLTPARVKFSEWEFGATISPRGIVVAENFGDSVDTGVRNQLWLAPNDGTGMFRYKPATHATPYTDSGSRIDSRYRGPYMPDIDTEFLVNYHPGTEVRATGVGNMSGIAYGYDDVRTQTLAPITLSASPGVVYTRLMDLRNERASIEWRNGNSAGDWFQLSGWDQYYAGATKHR
jgi:hypothetical protein